jgi:hypothetical protein
MEKIGMTGNTVLYGIRLSRYFRYPSNTLLGRHELVATRNLRVGEFISFIFTLIFLIILSLMPATLIAALLSLRNARVKYRRALPLPGWSLVKNKFLVQSTEAGKWLLRLALSISMLAVVLVCGVYIYEAVK